MNIVEIIRSMIKRERFAPTFLSLFINPGYLIRKGLYRNLREVAPIIYGNVLDFGSGSKPYRNLFSNSVSYIGLDIEVSGHDHTDSAVDIYYDGRRIPWSDGHFDAVVSFEVFEHIFNLDEIITEIVRVLKPGGRLLITIPFAWGEHEVPYDFARYTSFGIRHILEKSGFTIEESRKVNRSFLAIAQIFINYFFDALCPKNKLLSFIFRLIFIFPLNAAAIVINLIMPFSDNYYSNLIILAKINDSPQRG